MIEIKRAEFKIVQSMVRLNLDQIVRKSSKQKTVDPRNAGMDFYIDLDAFFKTHYKDYWNDGLSEKLNIAFYEPDYKKLDNLNE